MDQTRVAFGGAGSLAMSVHYPSLSEIEDVEIVAIAELNEEHLREAALKFGVRETFHDYR